MENKNQKVGFFYSYGLLWRNYFKFSGHSQRSEYWWPFLINTIINAGISGWWLLLTYGIPFIYYVSVVISGKEIAILYGILLVIAVVNVVLCVLPTKINNNQYRKMK